MTLFGAFNITAVLVALNMLIAILNDSYVQITVSCILKKWLFHRCRTCSEFLLVQVSSGIAPLSLTKS